MSDPYIPLLIEKLEARMLSGEPFTYGGLCAERGDKLDKGRMIDKAIQRLRRRGLIAFIREGRNVVWRPVATVRTHSDALTTGCANANPVEVTISCPKCATPHIDEGEWATTRHHKTHQCQTCGHEWRPFPFATVGVPHLILRATGEDSPTTGASDAQ